MTEIEQFDYFQPIFDLISDISEFALNCVLIYVLLFGPGTVQQLQCHDPSLNLVRYMLRRQQ